MGQDGRVSSSDDLVVLEPRPGSTAPNAIVGLSQIAASTAFAVSGLLPSTLGAAAERVVNAALDAVVPPVVDAIISRINLTEVVLDNVDIDHLVAAASMEPIIDRLPLVDLANYIIDEIDLSKIIRQSSGGIATDAVSSARVQAVEVDTMLTSIVDKLLRRGQRDGQVLAPPADSQRISGA